VKEPAMCARRLTTEALARGAGDNITVVVAFLRPLASLEEVFGAGGQARGRPGSCPLAHARARICGGGVRRGRPGVRLPVRACRGMCLWRRSSARSARRAAECARVLNAGCADKIGCASASGQPVSPNVAEQVAMWCACMREHNSFLCISGHLHSTD